jgi:hypothetical protein
VDSFRGNRLLAQGRGLVDPIHGVGCSIRVNADYGTAPTTMHKLKKAMNTILLK